jgi:hypothetical protein
LDAAVSVDLNGGLDPGTADGVVVWGRFDGTAGTTCCSRIQTATHITSGP